MNGARVAFIAMTLILSNQTTSGAAVLRVFADTTAVTMPGFGGIISSQEHAEHGVASPRAYAQGHSHQTRGTGSGYDEEGSEQSQPCGHYFKGSSLPYFRDYYSQDNYANLPPGLRKHLQKSGHLPPGLEKKYAQTGQLPPGLQKRFDCGQTFSGDDSPYLYPVPEVVYERLGPLPPDSTLYLYGRDLILLNDHTKAIIDILRGVY